MTDPFDCPEFLVLCTRYRLAPAFDMKGATAAYEALQAYCRRVSAPKPLDFPEIDSSLIPLDPGERQRFEPFPYTERN